VLWIYPDYMLNLSTAITEGLATNRPGGGEVKLLQTITKPLVKLIVQIDKTVLQCWSNANCTEYENASLIKSYCGKKVLQSEDVKVMNLLADDTYDDSTTIRVNASVDGMDEGDFVTTTKLYLQDLNTTKYSGYEKCMRRQSDYLKLV